MKSSNAIAVVFLGLVLALPHDLAAALVIGFALALAYVFAIEREAEVVNEADGSL